MKDERWSIIYMQDMNNMTVVYWILFRNLLLPQLIQKIQNNDLDETDYLYFKKNNKKLNRSLNQTEHKC